MVALNPRGETRAAFFSRGFLARHTRGTEQKRDYSWCMCYGISEGTESDC